MAASFQQDAPPGKKQKSWKLSPHRNKVHCLFFINSKTQKRNFGWTDWQKKRQVLQEEVKQLLLLLLCPGDERSVGCSETHSRPCPAPWCLIYKTHTQLVSKSKKETKKKECLFFPSLTNQETPASTQDWRTVEFLGGNLLLAELTF